MREAMLAGEPVVCNAPIDRVLPPEARHPYRYAPPGQPGTALPDGPVFAELAGAYEAIERSLAAVHLLTPVRGAPLMHVEEGQACSRSRSATSTRGSRSSCRSCSPRPCKAGSRSSPARTARSWSRRSGTPCAAESLRRTRWSFTTSSGTRRGSGPDRSASRRRAISMSGSRASRPSRKSCSASGARVCVRSGRYLVVDTHVLKAAAIAQRGGEPASEDLALIMRIREVCSRIIFSVRQQTEAAPLFLRAGFRCCSATRTRG